jgi:hypothetical protein
MKKYEPKDFTERCEGCGSPILPKSKCEDCPECHRRLCRECCISGHGTRSW